MIRRAILPVLWCAAALAQLPSPQAAPPKPEPESRNRKAATQDRTVLQVDARVTDFRHRPATGLTAADFSIETDGKPQKVEECRYVEPRPARVALLVDDLSLSLQHLTAVTAALRTLVDELPADHELAILRTSGGEGTLEQFTSDRAILAAALDQISYSPLQAKAGPNVFQVGTMGALHALLEGLRIVPGRKAVLVFSERLREPQRVHEAPRQASLRPAANRGSAVVYAFDAVAADPPSAVMLDEGIAALAEDTGGKIFEHDVDPAQALAQVLRDQAGYYALSFAGEGLPFDYINRIPKIDRLVVQSRKDLIVHARRGAMGGAADLDEPFLAPGTELSFAVANAFAGSRIRTRLTPIAGLQSPSGLDAVTHIDIRDLALIKRPDRLYHGELQLSAELFATTSMAVQRTASGVTIRLQEAPLAEARVRGFDCKLHLTVPVPGIYQLRVAVSDVYGGGLGSASQLVEIPDWNGKLTLSSIILRDAAENRAPDARPTTYLEENAPLRIFAPGFRIPYTYTIHNLHRDKDKHGQIEVRSSLYRDGVPIYSSAPKLVEIDLPEAARSASAGGYIALTSATEPGRYLMYLTVTDKLAPAAPPQSITQTIDFQVRR